MNSFKLSYFPLMGLVAGFVGVNIISNLIGASLILVQGFTVSSAIFLAPLAYVLIDITSELYGKKVAQALIFVGILSQLMTVFFVWLGGIFPSAPRRDLHLAYEQMFGLVPRMALGSIIAYFFSSLIDLNCFTFISNRYPKLPLGFRSVVTSFIGQAVDVVLFMGIFLYGTMPNLDLAFVSLTLYIIKCFLLILNVPVLYAIRLLILKISAST